jgi:hypothetical protein
MKSNAVVMRMTVRMFLVVKAGVFCPFLNQFITHQLAQDSPVNQGDLTPKLGVALFHALSRGVYNYFLVE